MKDAERNTIERGEKRDRKVREAVELLDTGVEGILEGEAFKRYLAFAARFHRYSSNNALLILVQRPNATRVTGYRKWQDLGRQVRRGEEGLKILAPIFRTIEDEHSGEKARVLCSFKVVKVFDVSQTDPLPGSGPLPERPRPKPLCGDSEAARTLGRSLLSFCESKDVPVSENDSELDTLSPGANGVYSRREKRIILRSKLSADGKAKTLVHELVHHLLHRDPTAMEAYRPTFEAEAEGTAYTVLSYFGVDASNYSFAYVAHWAERKELFKTTICNIQRAAHEIIESVESGWMWTEKASERGVA